MAKPKKQPKNYFRVATTLLIVGLGMILLSLFISIMFIQGTTFKQEYQRKQHQQCLERGNSQSQCDKSFRE